MWVLYLYGVVVVLTAASALFKGAIWPGVTGLAGPALCLWVGIGVRGSFHVGSAGQKVGGLLAGLVFLAVGLGLLYASGYWVRLHGLELDGVAWGAVGTLLGLLLTTKSASQSAMSS